MPKARIQFKGKGYKRSLPQVIELVERKEYTSIVATKMETVIYETTNVIIGNKMIAIERELGSVPKNRWYAAL